MPSSSRTRAGPAHLRSAHGGRALSHRELAERMGTTQAVISRLEEGGGARNRIDTLARVASALGRHLVASFPVPARLEDAVQVARCSRAPGSGASDAELLFDGLCAECERCSAGRAVAALLAEPSRGFWGTLHGNEPTLSSAGARFAARIQRFATLALARSWCKWQHWGVLCTCPDHQGTPYLWCAFR